MKGYMQAGKFKAECLKVMDEVKQTKRPVIITKHNIPVVKVVPIDYEQPVSIFGCLENSVETRGDITKPIGEKWDVLS